MEIGITVFITAIAGVLSWWLPAFVWRFSLVLVCSYLSSVGIYAFSLWLNPSAELSSWHGLLVDGSFVIALGVGVYIVLVIQLIKVISAGKKDN